MNRKEKYRILLLCIFAALFASCALTRVLYSEETDLDGVQAKVVVLDSGNMNELVITMQETGGAFKERVFRINWMPDHYEIDDYDNDSHLDFKIVSTSGEVHYFYGTELGFRDI